MKYINYYTTRHYIFL